MSKWFKHLYKNKNVYGKEAFAFISCFAFYQFLERKIISFALAKGLSMEPTIWDSDVVVIDKFFYKYFSLFDLKYGDVVVAQPIGSDSPICKRIKGL
jgi:signal peptidase I